MELEEEGGLGESAKWRRACERILHWRHADDLTEGRLDIRSDFETGDEAIESKTNLGTNRASGCIAYLLRPSFVSDEMR